VTQQVEAPPRLPAVTAVAVGGVLGALARTGVGVLLPAEPGMWAWSTLVVNTTGGFALGALLALLAVRVPRTPYPRLLLGTGALGGYTTFSAFSVDVVGLIDAGRPAAAAAYALCSVVVLLAATAAGSRAVRWSVGRSA
jgi:CrcB protein